MLQGKKPSAPRSSTTGNFTYCVYEGKGTRGSLGKGIIREERDPQAVMKTEDYPGSAGSQAEGPRPHLWPGMELLELQRRITEGCFWLPCTTCRISILTRTET